MLLGTNCAPLVVDLFLFCYKRDFMTSLSDDIQADIIEALYGNVSSCGFWQTRDLHLSRSTLYLLSPRLCFFIVLKRDLFVYRDGSLTR